MNTVDTFKQVIENFSDYLLNYFLALAAVGALAMALLELWKKLCDSRTRFHAKVLTEWIMNSPRPENHAEAYAELLHLTTGLDLAKAKSLGKSLAQSGGGLPIRLGISDGLDDALFALELDQMLGHIQDAVDVAVNNPSHFKHLYAMATAGAAPDDVEFWRLEVQKPMVLENISAADSKKRADTFTRLQQIAKRKLDALQVYSTRRWVNWNQLRANIFGIVLMAGGLIWLNAYKHMQMHFLWVILLSLTGGMLSPLAKDMVLALKKVRGG